MLTQSVFLRCHFASSVLSTSASKLLSFSPLGSRVIARSITTGGISITSHSPFIAPASPYPSTRKRSMYNMTGLSVSDRVTPAMIISRLARQDEAALADSSASSGSSSKASSAVEIGAGLLLVSKHRPFSEFELQHCRRVDGYEFRHDDNPGFRLEPHFFRHKSWQDSNSKSNDTESDSDSSRGSSAGVLDKLTNKYSMRDGVFKKVMEVRALTRLAEQGQIEDEPEGRRLLIRELDALKESGIGQVRLVTGVVRLSYQGVKESATGLQQRRVRISGQQNALAQAHSAPWGFGDGFRRDKVPEQLLALVDKIESHQYYKIKKNSCRHICIDYYEQAMFREDPAVIDPAAGSNVFILGLKSDAVLTLTPNQRAYSKFLEQYPTKYRQPISNLAQLASSSGRDRAIRADVREVATRSFTDADVDILSLQGHLLHLEGPARETWALATRMGVEGTVAPYEGVCDWFGDVNSLRLRGQERVQVTLGFE